MEESPFDFQPNPLETYEADLFSCNGNAFAFDNAEEQPSNFRYMLESHEQELIPGLSPDTSLKNASDDSPKSQIVTPGDLQCNVPGTVQPLETTSTTPSQKSHARLSKNHRDHPYPTPIEKAKLEEETGLQRNQVAFCLANARLIILWTQ